MRFRQQANQPWQTLQPEIRVAITLLCKSFGRVRTRTFELAEAEQRVNQGGFAGTIGAEQSDDASEQGEAEILQNLPLAEMHVQIIQFNDRLQRMNLSVRIPGPAFPEPNKNSPKDVRLKSMVSE